MNDHDNHQTTEREIAELSALKRMRERATDDDSTSLRLGCATHLLSELRTVSDWNQLPAVVVEQEKPAAFKAQLARCAPVRIP